MNFHIKINAGLHWLEIERSNSQASKYRETLLVRRVFIGAGSQGQKRAQTGTCSSEVAEQLARPLTGTTNSSAESSVLTLFPSATR